MSVSVCFCICDAISLPLLSVVLFTLNDGKCRQTSKQFLANSQCEWALGTEFPGQVGHVSLKLENVGFWENEMKHTGIRPRKIACDTHAQVLFVSL